jgi:hypothetical protein
MTTQTRSLEKSRTLCEGSCLQQSRSLTSEEGSVTEAAAHACPPVR